MAAMNAAMKAFLSALVAASLTAACSTTMHPTAPSLRAGLVSASVPRIRTGAFAYPREYDNGKTEISEVDADVHVKVRNHSDGALRFEAVQLALFWDQGGCRAGMFRLPNKAPVRELSLAAREEKDVRFVCYHFPLNRNRTLEGSDANDDERRVSTVGRPQIALALWARPDAEPQVGMLLPTGEYHFVAERVQLQDPPWSLGLGVQIGAAPSLTGAPYRSFLTIEFPWTIRPVELSLGFTSYQKTTIAVTNERARTVAITPALGFGASRGSARIQARAGWSWAPRFERDGNAHGPNVRLSFLWGLLGRRARMTSPEGSITSIANGQRLGLSLGWTRLYASGLPAGAKDADMLTVGVAFEELWAPGG